MLHVSLVSEYTLTEVLLLLLAFVLSAVIGAERERRLKSAGLRTLTLVGLGSALFTLVSAYGFQGVLASEVVVDPSRIAAQIVSGIGFLGAGVVFVQQSSVSGLTTAASIWVTAAIGMACGAGMVVVAVGTTLLYLVAVSALSPLRRHLLKLAEDEVFILRYQDGKGVLREVLQCATRLGYVSSLSSTRRLKKTEDASLIEASMKFRHHKGRDVDTLAGEVSDIDGLISIEIAGRDND